MEAVEEMVTHAMVKQLKLPDLDVDDSADSCQEESKVEGVSEKAKKPVDRSSIARSKSSDSFLSGDEAEIRSSKKMSSLNAADSIGDPTLGFAPTGDVRREVLNMIFLKGIQGGNTIAAGTRGGVMESLKQLEHKRAVELLMNDSNVDTGNQDGKEPDTTNEDEDTKRKSSSVGLDNLSDDGLGGDSHGDDVNSEEDETLEAVRLKLIQHRVAKGNLDPVDAAKVLQHASIQRVRSDSGSVDLKPGDKDFPKVDAGDVEIDTINRYCSLRFEIPKTPSQAADNATLRFEFKVYTLVLL